MKLFVQGDDDHEEETLVTVSTVAGVLSALRLIAFYLALHDIYHDYASAKVIRGHVAAATTLPDWIACAGISALPLSVGRG